MKKILFILLITIISSCSKDDDGSECLVCTSFGTNDITDQSELDGFCVGAAGEDGAGKVTKESLELMKTVLEYAGASCKIQ